MGMDRRGAATASDGDGVLVCSPTEVMDGGGGGDGRGDTFSLLVCIMELVIAGDIGEPFGDLDGLLAGITGRVKGELVLPPSDTGGSPEGR